VSNVGQAAKRMSIPDQPDNLAAYIGLGKEDIVRLVLCMLIEEGLGRQLSAFRSQQLPTQPVESHKEFIVGRDNVVPVCNRAG
jgi:hypothetical protein